MPKETVNTAGASIVRVGWGNRDDMQIGVELTDGRGLLIEMDGKAEPPPTPSLWANLSRADCNRLIKLLRKARDSAFGRDE